MSRKSVKKGARNGKVDLLKFLFSIVVISFHFANAVDYDNELFHSGYIAVEFFFLVSGYLFANSLSKIECTDGELPDVSIRFMKKKYLSFMPYHLFMVVALFIYMFFHYDWGMAKYMSKLLNSIPDILLIQMSLKRQQDLLGHEWYISAMLFVMFILTPIIIKYRTKYTKIAAPVLSLLILSYLWRSFDGALGLVYEYTVPAYAGVLRAFAEISLGCVGYEVCKSGFFDKANKYLLIVFELFAYICMILFANDIMESVSPYVILILLTCAVPISFSDKASVGLFNNKFVYFLGKLSFPIYLIHILVRQFVAKLPWNYGYASHLLFYIAAVIVSAMVCIFVMDNITRMFEKKKKNR